VARARNLLVFVFVLAATNSAARDRPVPMVAWKIVSSGASVDAPLVLFWVPSSPDELKRSPLLYSAQLAHFSSRCVAMRIVRLDDSRRVRELQVGAQLPAVVLTEREGRILGRIDSEGPLNVRAVEDLVRSAIDRRTEEANVLLDLARSHHEAGDIASATEIYEVVRDQRCVSPREARDADRALKKLRKQ
jgi:hypothetical protein